jgi:hypothetical protein
MSQVDPSHVYNTTLTTARRVRAALERARADAAAFEADPVAALAQARAESGARAPGSASLQVAMGDPQAPLSRVLEILDRHDLLSDAGRVHPEAELVSVGDHFDWGPAEQRAFAAESGYALLAWLAAQPDHSVGILAGNHDLARVGELLPFDDATFAAAREEARALRAIRIGTPGRAERRHAFLENHRTLPSVGVVMRDLSTYEARQRELVAALLRGRRFHAAKAAGPDLLLIHAGLTGDDLDAIGFAPGAARASAPAIAQAIQQRFDDAIDSWDGVTPFAIDPLYRPGNYRDGESRGVFVQRPADPAVGDLPLFEGPPRRRFDPRVLPLGVTQVTGHIRDQKCRELMPVWSDDDPARDGPLRHLWTDGRRIRYRRGLPPGGGEGGAVLLFADGGMNHAPPADYELLDLGERRALVPRP